MSEFPERIEFESTGRRGTYTLRPDLYAVHDWDGPAAGDAAAAPVLTLPEARLAVFSGSPAGRMPVYTIEPGGGLFVPTGTIWVRFAEGTNATNRAADLEKIGFRIERSPKSAPHAAYVIAAKPAEAFSRLLALRAMEGVEHVEMQMLSPASSR